MKKIYSVIIPMALVIVLLNSCATVYRCGEPRPLKATGNLGKKVENSCE